MRGDNCARDKTKVGFEIDCAYRRHQCCQLSERRLGYVTVFLGSSRTSICLNRALTYRVSCLDDRAKKSSVPQTNRDQK